LRPHLYSLPRLPNAVPYVTAYYNRTWGFCLPDAVASGLQDGVYHAFIDSEFVQGGVDFAQCLLPGESKAEVLLTSYLCHPSMANNELSGPLALLGVYHRIAQWKRRRFSYRFLLNPETIGALCFLHCHGEPLRKNMAAGLVLTCLGGPKPGLRYKQSRRGDSILDQLAASARANGSAALDIEAFDPAVGSDERQYCSPGFNLPVGQVARTPYAEYAQYHTSLDTKAFMDIGTVYQSVNDIEGLLKLVEISGYFRNLQPFGEPHLASRNLYRTINRPPETAGAADQSERFRRQLMTILNYSDGWHSMVEIAGKCGCPLEDLRPAIEGLEESGLLSMRGGPGEFDERHAALAEGCIPSHRS
jgi:aminopeptidase-like protein